MWFKSDISIYQKDDFRYYLKKCPCLGTVWEWLQRTSVIEESGTFNLTLPLKGMFCEDYQITETNFNNALEHLANLNLINFDNNSITIFGWENNQGAYLVQKEYKKNWIAEKRGKKSKEENVESMSNRQTIDSDSTKYPVDILEEIRVDKNRVDKNKKEENILNTSRGEEKKINKKEKEIFLPPTQPEVIEYLLSKSEEYANLANYSICEQIAKKYITHFEAESWVKVNNKPIRSWKLDLNKRLEGDWLAPHLFKPKTESKAVAQWAQMVNNAQDRVVRDIMNEMRQKGKV